MLKKVIEKECQRDEIGIHGGFKILCTDCIKFEVIEREMPA
jgi:hypothetical protein